eukprot:6197997-Amphidinium_carterae.1
MIAKETIRNVTSSHASWRTANGYPGSQHTTSWRAGWPASAAAFITMMGEVVYGSEYNDALKKHIVHRR